MKHIIISVMTLFATTFCSYGQIRESLYLFLGNEINVKSKFLDVNYVDRSTSLEPYIFKKIDTLFVSNQYGFFKLKLSKFNGYDDEPGMCNVIEIIRNNTTILKLENSKGYADISSYVSSENRSYSFLTLGENMHLLIFNEWIYASQPSIVSLILIYNDKAKLIYNKPMFINSIYKTNGVGLAITLQSNTVEYGGTIDNPVMMNTPNLHYITWNWSSSYNFLYYE